MSAVASLAALQQKVQVAAQEYQKLQIELSAVVDARQKLDAQLQENELVKKVPRAVITAYSNRSYSLQEFASLTPNNTIYKMIGPVLIPQDQAEANATVDKRLEFIKSDM
jgi:prefoldin beta subunit